MTLSDPIVRRLGRARELARDAFADPLSLDDLARAAGLSRFFFHRAFAEAYGVTPHRFLVDVRLDQAKRALARGASVTEACFAVGFSSVGSFSALFHRRVGASPRDWQRSARAVVGVPSRWPSLWIPGCFLLCFASSNFGEAATAGAR